MAAGSGLNALVQMLLQQARTELSIATVYFGVIDSVEPVDESWRVKVSGLADEPVACAWSSIIDLELSAMGTDLVGQQVRVDVVGGQRCIAYRVIPGVV
jgi:hypothetical protein